MHLATKKSQLILVSKFFVVKFLIIFEKKIRDFDRKRFSRVALLHFFPVVLFSVPCPWK